MVTTEIMKKRTKEEKEQLLKDIQRLGVVAGCRKFGIDPSTYYTWLERYTAHGIDGLEDRRGRWGRSLNTVIRSLEKENLLLKQILADRELELKMKDELLKKKMAQWKDGNKSLKP